MNTPLKLQACFQILAAVLWVKVFHFFCHLSDLDAEQLFQQMYTERGTKLKPSLLPSGGCWTGIFSPGWRKGGSSTKMVSGRVVWVVLYRAAFQYFLCWSRKEACFNYKSFKESPMFLQVLFFMNLNCSVCSQPLGKILIELITYSHWYQISNRLVRNLCDYQMCSSWWSLSWTLMPSRIQVNFLTLFRKKFFKPHSTTPRATLFSILLFLTSNFFMNK